MPVTRDVLSRGYEIPVAAFLGRLTSAPPDIVAQLPGGQRSQQVFIASPPGTPSDGVAGSDLNINERAWVRAAYRYMRLYHSPTTGSGSYMRPNPYFTGRGLSLIIDWGPRTPAGRNALVRILPRGQAPEDESYSVNPELQAQARR